MFFMKFSSNKVNASPSLTANTETDYDLKFGLLDDVFFDFVMFYKSIRRFEKYMIKIAIDSFFGI